MIQPGTQLNVADNTGAKIVECFNIPGGTRKHYARLGEVITGSIKKAEPRREVKTHQKVKAVIIRQKQNYKRSDGSYIRFDENACALLSEGKNIRGNRIFGPVPRELKDKGFEKIVALAKDVV